MQKKGLIFDVQELYEQYSICYANVENLSKLLALCAYSRRIPKTVKIYITWGKIRLTEIRERELIMLEFIHISQVLDEIVKKLENLQKITLSKKAPFLNVNSGARFPIIPV